MKHFPPPRVWAIGIVYALVTTGCANIYNNYDGQETYLGTNWVWDKMGSILWFGVLLGLVYGIYRLFWLPRGYKLVIGPGTGGSSYDGRYDGELYAPTGDILPGKWGNYNAPMVIFIRAAACQAARTHKKWGKL